MEYNIRGLEIKAFFDESAIDNIICECEELLEPYEQIEIVGSISEIRVMAFNITNGEYRSLIDINPSDHIYAEIHNY